MVHIRVLAHAELSRDLYRILEEALTEAFPGTRVTIDLQAAAPPPSLLNPTRGQYSSTMVLQSLRTMARERGERVLDVEAVDLYAGDLNFVFGEADPDTGTAVVSTHRLRPELYGEEPSPGRLLSRLIKEAVHELGHTFRLGHCPNPQCVMHFSNSILDTDIKGPRFCQRCRPRLRLD
jgi:archaemetzincin